MTRNDRFSITLIGGGNMGAAMLGGWIADGIDPSLVCVVDPNPSPESSARMKEWGVATVQSGEGLEPPDVLVLAVKPQVMAQVLSQLSHLAGPQTVSVSVAAGITLAQLEKGLGAGRAIIRAMPNTPALVRRGMTVACANADAGSRQRAMVDRLLRATGALEWVEDEALIDGVTAVSGSGPAYVFHLAECMARAGVAAGLPAGLAMKLACETVSGAGELLAQSGQSPELLRKNVTSPNGTTAAALEVLMRNDAMAKLLEEAIAAAKRRSEELSK